MRHTGGPYCYLRVCMAGMVMIALFCAGPALRASAAVAADAGAVRAAVLRVDARRPPPISRLDLPPPDLGFAGGALATADNQTTGSFLGQTYATRDVTTDPDEATTRAQQLVSEGIKLLVVAAPEPSLLAIADAVGRDVLVINAAAEDDSLRNGACRANMLHVAPSRAMLADALAQFLMWKRWDRWVLLHGSHPEDRAMAGAYRHAARKFGARIVDEKLYEDTGGARRTDSGHVQVQKQMPVFTQKLDDHDVVIAADEADVFAAYLPYQTWEPRPVAGSAGLRPTTFHPAHEAWGATQFQRRFEKTASRRVRPLDYQVWLALRVIGEAATRTRSADPAVLRAFMLGPDFELAAFKGQKVTFRDWNGQMRQPVLLTGDRVPVSVSPQTPYLHQVSRLDTLGHDRPESTCNQF